MGKDEYKVIKEIATISEREAGTLKLSLISWNDGPPVYDLRTWPDGPGLTLDETELIRLGAAIQADRLGKKRKK